MLRLEGDDIRDMPAEAQHVYVYGTIRVDAGGENPNVPPLKGLAGNPVRTVAGCGVAALVSTLTAGSSFGDDMKDPERVKSLILDHHRVLQRMSDNRTVLPMRFGAVFAGDESVREALYEHRQGLLEMLERVEGAREWGVKIFCDRLVLRNHLGEESQALLAAQGELAAAKQGRAFFLRRRIARLSEEEIQRAIAQRVEESHRRLSDAARADAAMKLQPAAVHGRAGDMVWNGAFLVAKPAEERFFALIGELQRVHGPHGFHTETNGPWPPFSFADCRLGE